MRNNFCYPLEMVIFSNIATALLEFSQVFFRTRSFTKIAWPVHFLPCNLECYLFINDVDIQLILEFKHNFGKLHPVFPKNP